ncbi:hypothetical protein LTR37_002690 [Vermiconidia calcicola]|uniref:Uncharacterized protein n=1 Tax=Vermiconidia calcicola TaxID=1690605 RepID=A0ACC3NT96_9PEZI|nr:hypothetical protein LTR37_002690 [Vermiconidia calcicola]
MPSHRVWWLQKTHVECAELPPMLQERHTYTARADVLQPEEANAKGLEIKLDLAELDYLHTKTLFPQDSEGTTTAPTHASLVSFSRHKPDEGVPRPDSQVLQPEGGELIASTIHTRCTMDDYASVVNHAAIDISNSPTRQSLNSITTPGRRSSPPPAAPRRGLSPTLVYGPPPSPPPNRELPPTPLEVFLASEG